MNAFAECPECATSLEFSLDARGLLDSAAVTDHVETFDVNAGGITLRVRCPDSRDLSTAARASDPTAAQGLLFAACVIGAEKDGHPVAPDMVSETARAAVADAILANDPLTEVSLDLTCPACGMRWPLLFDVLSFFWEELGHHALRLIGEVTILARTFGWSERDILAMSPARRQSYLSGAG
jgi:hypothetical protein